MESPLDITLLIDDLEMQRLVATWPKLPTELRLCSLSLINGGVTKQEQVVFIARAANISEDRVSDVIYRAKLHGIIYDDGTINTYAEKWLTGMIGARIAEQVGKANKARGKKDDAGKPKPD